VKVLIDENLPRTLVDALRAEGHEAESVHTLHQQGIDNGALYSLARLEYDLTISASHETPASSTMPATVCLPHD
jgi:predicted nuclease of predicted toxin-antitoxin system